MLSHKHLNGHHFSFSDKESNSSDNESEIKNDLLVPSLNLIDVRSSNTMNANLEASTYDCLASFRPFEITTNLVENDNLFRLSLEKNLSTDFNALIKAERNFFQKDKQIIISEETLIHECLMVLSGLRSSLLFTFENGDYVLNKKFRLRCLNNELKSCLKKIGYYGKIVLDVEMFIRSCYVNSSNGTTTATQIYEAFAQCLIEYLRYFRDYLNRIGTVLVKRERKFTLIDFLNCMSMSSKVNHFVLFDLLKTVLVQLDRDVYLKENYKKSLSLLSMLHKFLIDSFNRRNHVYMESKFLMWLFVRSLKPYFSLIDTFIREGIFQDCKEELGFRRHSDIKIDDINYWTNGYEMFDELKYLINQANTSTADTVNTSCEASNVPKFLLDILLSLYKICKHTEIIKVLVEFDAKSNLCEQFLNGIKRVCPFLKNDVEDSIENGLPSLEKSTQLIKTSYTNNDETSESTSTKSLLEINFAQLRNHTQLYGAMKKNEITIALATSIVSIDKLIEQHEREQLMQPIEFIMENKLNDILNDTLIKYVNYCSNLLIVNLFDKYNMEAYFMFIHSYYLFKRNETVFLFSKSLFEMIRAYETYQEDAILNSLFYKSANLVFTTNTMSRGTQGTPFKPRLVRLSYDNVASTSAAMSTANTTAMMQTSITTSLSLTQSLIQLGSKLPNLQQAFGVTTTKPYHVQQTQIMNNFDSTSRLVNSIKLNIKSKWPLNLIIRQTDFDYYNRIFLFIMQIKQVKYELDILDLKDMDTKRINSSQNTLINNSVKAKHMPKEKAKFTSTVDTEIDEQTINKMLYIRFRLMNFINSFHDSICNQIYEANEEFIEKLKFQIDIDDMIRLHELFLLRIIKNYLIPNRPFQSCLLNIFNLILSFCDLWHQGIFYFTHEKRESVLELERNVNDYLQFMHKILSVILNKFPLIHFQSLMASIRI